eukprot:s1253_g11.t1
MCTTALLLPLYSKLLEADRVSKLRSANMRVCHGLAGEAVDVEDTEYRKPLDLVRSEQGPALRCDTAPAPAVSQAVCPRSLESPFRGQAQSVRSAFECWSVVRVTEDLIVLTCGGGTLSTQPSELARHFPCPCHGAMPAMPAMPLLVSFLPSGVGFGGAPKKQDVSGDVFFFLQKCLESEVDVVAARLDPADPTLAAFGGGEDLDEVVGQRCVDVIDPAFEAFRGNIAEARARIAESRPVAALALRCEERVAVQRLAARAVLDNLTSHRSACSRSMSLLAQKSSRVQTKLSDSLDKVEVSMKALESEHALVGLHAALQTQGRTTLADVMPRERIRRFTEALEAERAQLIQRLEKLQRQDSQLQALCDQVAERVEQLILEESVGVEAKAILEEQGRAQRELLPELRALVPSAGAAPSTVLEDEKRSALVLDSVKTACANVRSSLDQLQSCWDRQHQTFVQRLREVAYVQSKVRYVERQAALLEEEVNAQSNNSQQLNRLQKMPRAYNSTLREVALRRQFRARYLAQMVEVENSRRRAFLQRYSCYLPTDFVQGLGTLAPLATVEVPDFDSQLPEIDVASIEAQSGQALEASGPPAAASASSSRRPFFPEVRRSHLSRDAFRGSPSTRVRGPPRPPPWPWLWPARAPAPRLAYRSVFVRQRFCVGTDMAMMLHFLVKMLPVSSLLQQLFAKQEPE